MKYWLISLVIVIVVAVICVTVFRNGGRVPVNVPGINSSMENSLPADPAGNKKIVSRFRGKRVLEIDSYHEGFEWTANMTKGIRSVLGPEGIILKVVRMDTKRNPSEAFKKQAAKRAKQAIEEFDPDLVIVTDDNAAKYLLAPYYKNSKLPFVFLGINWQIDDYCLPYANTTGQIEMTHIQPLMKLLRRYAKGGKLGILSAGNFTEHKDVEYFKKLFKVKFAKEYYVKNFKEWKEKYLALQNEVDMMIMGAFAGIPDMDIENAQEFVLRNCAIPSGAYNREIMSCAMIGIVKKPEAIGRWGALAALKILSGTAPEKIPIAMNTQGQLIINMKIANKLGIVFSVSILKKALIIEKD